jgi:putative protease
MRAIIDAAGEAQLSAIIAADVAALTYANSIGVEVHLSTQLNISNIEALRFYAQFADVVVLARELTLEQVRAIHEQIVAQNIRGPKGELIRIEMFAHGALCMAISGKCYLSLHEMNASANRGACNQICRRGYVVRDKESDIELEIDNQYIMSPKDLKTIGFLPQMLEAGVQVFKIEGRARGAEYVRIVCECYKAAIAAYESGEWSDEKVATWDKNLARVFNRGFWNGYYLGQRLGEWSDQYGNQATEKKVYIGKVINYFSKLGVAEFLMETGSLSIGDQVLITGPTTGALFLTAEDIRVDLISVETTVKGERFSMRVPEKVRPSDKLFMFCLPLKE